MLHTVNFTATNSVAPDRFVYFSAHGFEGSTIWMHAPPSNRGATPAELNFSARATRWLRFTITKGVAPLCTSTKTEPGPLLGVAEIEVYEAIP